MGRIIFHIDVNSAYLSWEAAYRLQQGEKLDLRTIPSVVGGNEESRHGIVLAKSIPTKKFNIQTGESLYTARQKCPELAVVPPRYYLYMQNSSAMHELLLEYTPQIQRFSVDESFLDFSNMEHLYPDYRKLAEVIKERMKKELGFTVNIGISCNKLLAKVASDLQKPDHIHTLFPQEIKKKMWPLPVEDLFMVGRATAPKLHKLNIYTIGDLANYDVRILKDIFKKHGQVIWNYANGIEHSEVRKCNQVVMKGVGNSTTTAFDIEDRDTAYKVLLSLCETVTMRLRNSHNRCNVVSVSIKGSDFVSASCQKKLSSPTNSTRRIYEVACALFDSLWKGKSIRHLGLHLTELCSHNIHQYNLLDTFDYDKDSKLNEVMDQIRLKYGNKAIMKCCFLHSGVNAMCGGIGEEDYPLMSSML